MHAGMLSAEARRGSADMILATDEANAHDDRSALTERTLPQAGVDMRQGLFACPSAGRRYCLKIDQGWIQTLNCAGQI